jgi:hypothetical protein
MVKLKKAFMTTESIVYDYIDGTGEVLLLSHNFIEGKVYILHNTHREEISQGDIYELVIEQAKKDYESWKQWK